MANLRHFGSPLSGRHSFGQFFGVGAEHLGARFASCELRGHRLLELEHSLISEAEAARLD